MAHFWIMVICILALQQLSCANRLKRLEGRIDLVETRQDVESMLRRQDKSDVLDKLDLLEIQLNESVENPKCCASVQPERRQLVAADEIGSKYSTKDDFWRLMVAFKQEKTVNSRWRRRVPELEKTVGGVGTQLTDILNVVKEIRGEISDEQSVIEKILSEKMDASIQMISKAQETCKQNGITTKAFDKTLSEKMDVSIQTIAKAQETCEQNEITIKAFDKRLEAMESKIINLNENIETIMKLKKRPSSCLDIYRDGQRNNGIYDVYPNNRFMPIPVFCDMTTDGGGWTVFQRRQDGSEDFYRTWLEYEQGFGQLDGEFWLGNNLISSLTDKCCHELRVNLEDFEGNTAYAKYDGFQVRPMSENYKLIVGKYSGTAGDSLSYHANQQFSTKDRDNDEYSDNCAVLRSGAWWYKSCSYSNLNGQYLRGAKSLKGLSWYYWKSNYNSMKNTEMKFR